MKTTPLFMRFLTVPRLAFFSLAVGTALFLLVGVASASHIRADGNSLIYTANSASGNWLILTAEYAAPDEIVFVDSEPVTFEAGLCYRTQWDTSDVARCAVRNHLTVSTGNARDRIQVYERTPGWVTIEAGGGNDEIEAVDYKRSVIIRGEGGNDRILGGSGNDLLEGGAGNDHIEGNDGNDLILGGAGNDNVAGDALEMGNDDIDGGPGIDSITYDWRRPNEIGPLKLSLDNRANDGLPGEADNVVRVERFAVDRPVRFKAGKDAIRLEVYGVHAGDSRITGSRKGDRITAASGNDRINGGKGADRIIGGYGDDKITGGPGKDRINSGIARKCSTAECPFISDNDKINVRDGERDTVTCGPGRDKVIADQFDRVAKDCEKVKRKRVKRR